MAVAAAAWALATDASWASLTRAMSLATWLGLGLGLGLWLGLGLGSGG